MGLGDELMIAAMIRDYHLQTGKTVFFKNKQDITWRDNPAFGKDKALPYPGNWYWEEAKKWDATHAIDILCQDYNVQRTRLECPIYLNKKEIDFAKQVKQKYGKFITFEPNTKDTFTKNKWYPYWETLLSKIKMPKIQVGVGKNYLATENFNNKLTFHQTVSLISQSSLFIGTEGGLMHAISSFDLSAIIIYTGCVSPSLTGYEKHIKIFNRTHCSPCHKREKCLDYSCANISPEVVYDHILQTKNE